MTDRLQQLSDAGVSIWLDDLSRERLETGNLALFHTDGVTEARNGSGECFDVERLTEQLIKLHGKDASEIVTTIADVAWQWAGTPTDDVSLMAVKKVGSDL